MYSICKLFYVMCTGTMQLIIAIMYNFLNKFPLCNPPYFVYKYILDFVNPIGRGAKVLNERVKFKFFYLSSPASKLTQTTKLCFSICKN